VSAQRIGKGIHSLLDRLRQLSKTAAIESMRFLFLMAWAGGVLIPMFGVRVRRATDILEPRADQGMLT
jgi:hypothetical protein